MKSIVFIFSLVTSILICAFSCNKQEEKTYINLYFELPISVSPVKDMLHIGDTLWIEASFSDSIYDATTQKKYPVHNFDFQTRISLFKIDSTKYLSQQPGALNSFSIVNIKGGIVQPQQTFGGFQFIYFNNKYKAKTGLIPKNYGVFNVGLFSQTDATKNIQGISQELFRKAGDPRIPLVIEAGIRYPINNGIATNYHLYKRNSKLGDQKSSTNVYAEQKELYTFIVVD